MLVKELIAILNTLPEDAEVCVAEYTEYTYDCYHVRERDYNRCLFKDDLEIDDKKIVIL